MKKYKYISYILNIVLLLLLFFVVKNCQPEEPEEKIIIEYKEVEVPKIIDSIPKLVKPKTIVKTVTEIDSTYYNKYKELQDQVKKDSLFKETIKINEYKETFEDENVKIDVYTKTRGEVLAQSIPDYTVKPRTESIPHTTIIKAEPKKVHVYGGLELGLPPKNISDFRIKGNIFVQGKKGNITTFSVDNTKTFYVGKVWKFW